MTHPATKLTIVVERLLAPAVERLLRREGIGGWSIFPGGGRGAHGDHPADAAQLVREFAIVKFEIVLRDRGAAERIADTLAREHLADQSGVIWLEAVEVLRAERF